MADKLTRQQQLAATNRGGRLLVSAAAGSGKTKVLVERLMGYLTDPVAPANLDDFLIITYTRAAAAELRGKIAAALTQRIAADPENRHLQRQMQRLYLTEISTVHGFCGDILREYAYQMDIPADFRVADTDECRQMQEEVLSDLLDRAYQEGNEDFFALVDTQGLGRNDEQIPKLILKVYDSARCHLNPGLWLEKCLSSCDVEGISDPGETIWGKFLLEQLAEGLDGQIRALTRCIEVAAALTGMEKVAENLQDTVFQLERLRESKSWQEVMARKDIRYGTLTFPKDYRGSDEAQRIKAVRNACKDAVPKLLKPFADPAEQVLADLRQSAPGARGIVEMAQQFERAYSQAKRSYHCLDFSDLEHITLDLLLGKSRSGATAAAGEIAARFREILVDEYQDSNQVQDAIFTVLTEKGKNCFMVGDVKQSIYQFRLADPGIFLAKYQSYAPAESAEAGQGRKVLLSSNFRSGGEVIEAVNHVFSACMRPEVGGLYYGEAEMLREGIPHTPLPDPGVELYALQVRQDSYGEEAAFTASRIQEMLSSGVQVREGDGLRAMRPEDIVILLRAPGSGSAGLQFQRALQARGIPCSSGGGNPLEAPEIEVLHSLLQAVYNPRQDIPLVAALASPAFGFTADDLAAIRSASRGGCIYEALKKSETPKAKHFLEILETLRMDARTHSLTELLEDCFRLTGMDSVYAAMPEGETKSANLQLFFQLAADYEAGGHRDLGQFLEHLETMDGRNLTGADRGGEGCVTIMSIHKSKGLEFPVVFLCGLAREFSRQSLQNPILCDKELGLGMTAADTRNRIRYPALSKRAISAKMRKEGVSEEMRVLYVAMTRARDRLIMTYADKFVTKEIERIALRKDFDDGALLTQEAGCPGRWVLMAAMGRTEAGELFALGGRPEKVAVSDCPWKIRVTQAPKIGGVNAEMPESREALPEETERQLGQALSFHYAHIPATQAPSKQTATGRKGRIKDEEAAEDTRQERREFRPLHPSGPAGKEYGSAMHAAMQYIRYEACGSLAAVQAEIQRLTEQGFLTAQQGEMVDCNAIARFFASEIGGKLRQGIPYLREFKFSILDDGTHYGEGLEGEQVLLQGVVDCALIEPEGITVVDFKTDRVTEETLPDLVARYSPQVQTYGEALSRIYEMPIRAKLLYFFRLNRFAEIENP